MSGEKARAILEYLEKFGYATLTHAVFCLLWDTSIRMSTLAALLVMHSTGEKSVSGEPAAQKLLPSITDDI